METQQPGTEERSPGAERPPAAQTRTATALAWWVFALVLGLLGVVLLAFGQFPAILLLLVALFIANHARKGAAAANESRAGEAGSREPHADRR